jgi:hypothetical protein
LPNNHTPLQYQFDYRSVLTTFINTNTMKMKNTVRVVAVLLVSSAGALVQAQTMPSTSMPNPLAKPATTVAVGDTITAAAMTDTTTTQLDQAVAANAKGDKAATVAALEASTAAVEKEAGKSSGDFKDKLMGQVGGLKKMIPLAKTGMLGGGVLGKAVSMVKMALGANRLSSMLGGGGSLLGKAAGLTGGLNLMKGGLGALGGSAQSSGSSLIGSALGAVGQLKGPGAAAAEPAVKSSIGSVLGFAKGIL